MYNINMLPVKGTTAINHTVMSAKYVMLETIRILEGLLNEVSIGTAALRLTLGNARFHVAACLEAIDKHLRTGGTQDDPASDVPELVFCCPLYMKELLKAKQEWNAWVKNAKPLQTPTELPKTPWPWTSMKGTTEEELLRATKPRPMEASVMFAGAALAIWGLSYVLRRIR